MIFPLLPRTPPVNATAVPVEGEGVVYSYTVIHPGAKSGLQPYALGYVDFPGPVRIFGRLQGRARPTIGESYVAKADETLGYVFEAVDA